MRVTGPWMFFGLAALSILMFSIDSTIVAVAIPAMTGDLNTNLAWIGWTLTAYALAQTIVMPLAGKLSETFGRLRVFLVCVALFTLGSLLCGLAPNVYLLIVFRALQGLGGGGFLPSAVGIVAKQFPRDRDRMVGLFASIFPIGGIIGPNLGGFILERASWRDVFLVNVPIGLLVLLALWRHARAEETTAERRPVDLAGAALFAGAIGALLMALTLLGNDSAFWQTAPFWLLLGASLALLALFVRQEGRAPEPVLDLRLVLRPPFLAVNAYNFVFGACVFGFFSFIPYYTVVAYGFGPAESGAVLTPRSLLMIATSTVASLFLIRLGYRAPMVAGMLLVALSLFLLSRGVGPLTLGGTQVGVFWVVGAVVGLAGIGMGLAAPSSNNAALDLLPERAAMVTGIRGLFRSTGGVLGTALIVLALELSPDKAAGLLRVFLVLSVLLLATVPLAFAIPDTARRRRQQPRPATPVRAR